MEEGFARWANPSSPHAEGRAARAELERARERIAQALDWPGEVILTSGASEAATLAMSARSGRAGMVSALEHDAILRAAPEADQLPARPDGALDPDALEAALAREPALVAVQHVNSETGNAQDIPPLAATIHAAGGLLAVDCAQSAGKLSLPREADLIVVSAHKLGGPVGIGALLLRDLALLAPSGGQERGYRRGTENLPAALGFAAALEACDDPYLSPKVLAADAALAETVREAGGVWLADRLSNPTPFIRSIAMPELSAPAQLMRLDMAGFAVSQGSACSSGTMRASAVLEAMGLEPALSERMIRVSYGWSTTATDIERFAKAWRTLVA